VSRHLRIDRHQREALNGHRGGVIYLTGLSGAGKTTLAVLLERRLHELGMHTYLLDGDELRRGICSGLGFSDADRVENMRRAVEIARLMVDAGLLTIVALISPFRAEREAGRARFAAGEFMEVFVDAPLDVCEARDPKGLYKKARSGEIAGFTGIDSPYEAPLAPDLRVDSMLLTPQEAAGALLARMAELGFIEPAGQASGLTSPSARPAAAPPTEPPPR
jgi:adenylyl-sulfate kinase